MRGRGRPGYKFQLANINVIRNQRVFVTPNRRTRSDSPVGFLMTVGFPGSDAMPQQDSPIPMTDAMEAIYDRFESAWENDAIPAIEEHLPSGRPPDEHRNVLLELVLIDLENRWQRFHHAHGSNSETASPRTD